MVARERNAYDPNVILEARIVSILREFHKEAKDIKMDPIEKISNIRQEIDLAFKKTDLILELVEEYSTTCHT